MAKKKPDDAPKRMGRPNLEGSKKTVKFNCRMTPEWFEWFNDFAGSLRKDKAVVFRDAVQQLAKGKGFREPPAD